MRDREFLYFDIETIPDQSPGALEKAMEGVTPPASYKNPESIEAWLAENRESVARESLSKTSFDASRGHVCTIAWQVGGKSDVASVTSTEEEAEAIDHFFAEALRGYHSVTLVGHNIVGFDIPFLTRRAIILGVKLPPSSQFPRNPKPWDRGVFDTMVAWGSGRDTISLDKLCGALGLPGKNGFDGSMVAEAWRAGEFARLAEYCLEDVAAVRAVHEKFLAAGF